MKTCVAVYEEPQKTMTSGGGCPKWQPGTHTYTHTYLERQVDVLLSETSCHELTLLGSSRRQLTERGREREGGRGRRGSYIYIVHVYSGTPLIRTP